MAIIVQKHGGSSVADAAKIRDVARKVAACKAEGHDIVVVVSAIDNRERHLSVEPNDRYRSLTH